MNILLDAAAHLEQAAKKIREANALLAKVSTNGEAKTPNRLTPTEEKVYARLSDGLDIQEIAEDLKISRKTADVHRDRIKKKLGFKTSKELTRSLRNK